MSAIVLHVLPCLVALSTLTSVDAKSALVVIDVQNCFVPGGSVPVVGGDLLKPIINDLRDKYDDVIWDVVAMSQDWHCEDHVSFARVNNLPEYEVKTLNYTSDGKLCADGVVEHMVKQDVVNCTANEVAHSFEQTLWPDHCVMDTTGAEFVDGLTVKDADIIVRKGSQCHLDSYSTFYGNGRLYETEMAAKLTAEGVDTVFVVGLASDFCVKFSALDSKFKGFTTYMIKDASRGVATNLTSAYAELAAGGVNVIEVNDLVALVPVDTSAAPDASGSSIATCSLLVSVLGLVLHFSVSF